MPLPSPRVPPLLSLTAVAGKLDVSIKTLRRWIGRGDLRAHRLGRQLRVSERTSSSSSPSAASDVPQCPPTA